MPLSPEEFYAHALAVADDEGRLSLSRMTGWEIFPFEQDGLRVAPVQPPVVPEPERANIDAATCTSCGKRDQGVWRDEHWRMYPILGVGVPLILIVEPLEHHDLADLPDDLAAELGVLQTRLGGIVEALPHIARCHVMRIGDGAAHLHIWFIARPEGMTQLRGSLLTVWDDLLPEYPRDVAAADARTVAEQLVASYGGQLIE